ncbi:Xanthine and CO dehydrogenases maturation factor, XdhC/CoxF family [hydrothermal vent metagenome]|uniref:Xanthine and CO dehydrogenases maturation factor, XdhC/CoxF family n=1 Tax=hydrothermal vent metagenome TaxID=652676 RepID=A0A3B0YMN9_9ZZZZ
MKAPDYEDIEIIRRSIELLADDCFITFCMVGRTWGSSPRPAGSLLAISQHGIMLGSVSGGCVEEDLLLKHNNGLFDHGSTTVLTYGEGEHNIAPSHINTPLKIPCGSILEIIVERIYDSTQLSAIYSSLCMGQAVNRLTDIELNTSSIEPGNVTDTAFYYDGKRTKRTFGPSWHLIIIGANDVSSYVSAMGRMLGYNIMICEPRKTYREAFLASHIEPGEACLTSNELPYSPREPSHCLNQKYEITRLMPDDAVKHYATHFSTIVLSLSHDPKLDDMALLAALELDLFYVGAIGSEKNNAMRKQRLADMGLSKGAIAKLHGPVGLNIHSKAPAEIAVAIFAELIKLRNALK